MEILINKLIPELEDKYLNSETKKTIKRYIGRYSLAGLFSLWLFYSKINYKNIIFNGVISMSSSVWFDN